MSKSTYKDIFMSLCISTYKDIFMWLSSIIEELINLVIIILIAVIAYGIYHYIVT